MAADYSLGLRSDEVTRVQMSIDERAAAFKRIADKYEISHWFQRQLLKLDGFEIVLVCDDSGSMRTQDYRDPRTNMQISRWNHLEKMISIIVEIGAVLDHGGVDVHFLNRPPLLNVTTPEVLHLEFLKEPTSGTPIVPVLSKLFAASEGEQRLIVLITDGEPTTLGGKSDVPAFKNLLPRMPDSDYLQIVACTTDRHTMEYLDDLDARVPRVDVTEDYAYEKRQIQNVQGASFSFTLGDYATKLLAGPVSPACDALDEYRIGSDDFERFAKRNRHAQTRQQYQGGASSGCCVLL